MTSPVGHAKRVDDTSNDPNTLRSLVLEATRSSRSGSGNRNTNPKSKRCNGRARALVRRSGSEPTAGRKSRSTAPRRRFRVLRALSTRTRAHALVSSPRRMPLLPLRQWLGRRVGSTPPPGPRTLFCLLTASTLRRRGEPSPSSSVSGAYVQRSASPLLGTMTVAQPSLEEHARSPV